MEPDTSKDDSPILNYDPTRYGEFEDYLPVTFAEGEKAKTLFIPAEYLNKQTEEERNKYTSRAHSLYIKAYKMIDPKKLANPQSVENIADLSAFSAVAVVYVNLWGILSFKMEGQDRIRGVALTSEKDFYPTTKEESHKLMDREMFDRLMAKLKPELYEEINSSYDASWFVWGHIFFSILYAIERDYGELDDIDRDRREVLFKRYKESDLFGDAFHRATHLWGQDIARRWLMDNKPAEWSIESLMEFMGIEPVEGEINDSYLTTTKLTFAQFGKLVSILKKDNHDALISVSYDEGGKIRIEPGMAVTDLVPLIAKAAKSKHGGRRYARVPDMSDDTREALGKRYSELKDSLTNVKQDAKAAYDIKGEGWQEHMLKKYPMLKDHPDLLEAVNVYRTPNDEEGSGVKDPWEIAMEVAAREVIPGYTSIPIAKRPSADALRRAAILPDEQE